MPKYDIGNATVSDMTTRVPDFTIDSMQTDAATGEKETEYQNSKWTSQWGYFNSVPDLKSAIILKAIWVVGKGFTTDTGTKVLLDHISGWGKDTFEDILFNLEVCKRIAGDAYAEIIREDGVIVNLKPLNPGSIKIVVDQAGIIKRYEQTEKTSGKTHKKFKPEDILHLSNNRLADQIHGISDIDALEKTILAEEENFEDMKKVMHRQAKPMIMFKLKTDNQGKINAFISKMEDATRKGENIYIPFDEESVSYEVVQVNVSQIIMEWRNDIRNKFYRSVGLPQIVPGGGGQSTESESKVIYLAFEQIVEKEQREIERQLVEQLGVEIDLYPPATLSQDLQRDEAKDAQNALTFQPSDTQAGVGR